MKSHRVAAGSCRFLGINETINETTTCRNKLSEQFYIVQKGRLWLPNEKRRFYAANIVSSKWFEDILRCKR